MSWRRDYHFSPPQCMQSFNLGPKDAFLLWFLSDMIMGVRNRFYYLIKLLLAVPLFIFHFQWCAFAKKHPPVKNAKTKKMFYGTALPICLRLHCICLQILY